MKLEHIGKLMVETVYKQRIVIDFPEDAEDEEQKRLQTRRLSFYLRNDCFDAGLRVRAFGVPYMILKMGDKCVSDPDALLELYQSFYREVLPKEMFEKNIRRQQ